MTACDARPADLLVAALNGARMPSMAEEVATERNTLRWRTAGSRMKALALESFELMSLFYPSRRHWGSLR